MSSNVFDQKYRAESAEEELGTAAVPTQVEQRESLMQILEEVRRVQKNMMAAHDFNRRQYRGDVESAWKNAHNGTATDGEILLTAVSILTPFAKESARMAETGSVDELLRLAGDDDELRQKLVERRDAAIDIGGPDAVRRTGERAMADVLDAITVLMDLVKIADMTGGVLVSDLPSMTAKEGV